MDVDDVALANLHLFLLLTERTEEILHQSPVEEGAILVHPRAFETSEVTHLGEGCLRCCHEPLLLVEVDEAAHLVTYLCAFRYVFLRHEDVPLAASIKEDTEGLLATGGVGVITLSKARDLERVVIA